MHTEGSCGEARQLLHPAAVEVSVDIALERLAECADVNGSAFRPQNEWQELQLTTA